MARLRTVALVVWIFVVPAASLSAQWKAGDSRAVSLGAGVTFWFNYCPPGSFVMGSPEGEAYDREADETQVRVDLTRPFFMGRYEVTQAQYTLVMGENPSQRPGTGLPVEHVTHARARDFCARLNELQVDPNYEFRLPTEAEWEYACRAGTSGKHSFGDAEPDEYAHLDSVFYVATNAVVGSRKPNPWGLYDMHGNVFEWCLDSYQERLPGGTDPLVTSGDRGVLRSGVVQDYRDVRSANRTSEPRDSAETWIGFRVVLAQKAEAPDGRPPEDERPSLAIAVVDAATNELVEGAQVRVAGAEPLPNRLGLSGAYFFDPAGDAPSTVLVTASKEGYLEYRELTDLQDRAGSVQPRWFARVFLERDTRRPTEVTIAVVDAETGQTIEGARIEHEGKLGDVVREEDGAQVFRASQTGYVRLNVHVDGYHERTTELRIAAEPARAVIELVPIPASAPGSLNEALGPLAEPTPWLNLRVFDASTNEPLDDARVELEATGTVAAASPPGWYRFDEVPRGENEFTVSRGGYLPRTVRVASSLTWTSVGLRSVTAADDPGFPSTAPPPAPEPPAPELPAAGSGVLSIQVLATSGEPITGLLVFGPTTGAPVERDGAYRVPLPAGIYDVRAQVFDGPTFEGRAEVGPGGESNFVLAQAEGTADPVELATDRLDSDGDGDVDRSDFDDATWARIGVAAGEDGRFDAAELTRLVNVGSGEVETDAPVGKPDAANVGWDALDTNQDGAVDAQDFEAEVWAMIRVALDLDASGSVDREELSAGRAPDPGGAEEGHAAPTPSDEDRADSLWARLDLNQDGRVSDEDFAAQDWSRLLEIVGGEADELSRGDLRALFSPPPPHKTSTVEARGVIRIRSASRG